LTSLVAPPLNLVFADVLNSGRTRERAIILARHSRGRVRANADGLFSVFMGRTSFDVDDGSSLEIFEGSQFSGNGVVSRKSQVEISNNSNVAGGNTIDLGFDSLLVVEDMTTVGAINLETFSNAVFDDTSDSGAIMCSGDSVALCEIAPNVFNNVCGSTCP